MLNKCVLFSTISPSNLAHAEVNFLVSYARGDDLMALLMSTHLLEQQYGLNEFSACQASEFYLSSLQDKLPGQEQFDALGKYYQVVHDGSRLLFDVKEVTQIEWKERGFSYSPEFNVKFRKRILAEKLAAIYGRPAKEFIEAATIRVSAMDRYTAANEKIRNLIELFSLRESRRDILARELTDYYREVQTVIRS